MKNSSPKVCLFALAALCLLVLSATSCGTEAAAPDSPLRFGISFSVEQSSEALDGRLLLLVSTDPSAEPRFQISNGHATQLIFGSDVENLAPEESAFIDAGDFGFPLPSIADIPAGEYWVQALLHRYETFQRSDGHTVKLPMDRGEGQQWNQAPGNLYSTPRKVAIDPGKDETIAISLDQVIPPIPEPQSTKFIKVEKIQSALLSDFWGRPMFLGAHVLLPAGFDEHPNAHYPLVINHGHFRNPYMFDIFRETPPDPALEPEYSARFDWEGYNRTVQEYAYKFYKYWIAPDTPRMIMITIQHPNPYFDDSYAVNSANLGPYGDAINQELIPYIEEKYRGLGEGWARFTYGGSTGGWEAIGVQVMYPDFYNGCFAACPDPIDFQAYQLVNIYEDRNAYFLDSKWKKTPIPETRNYLGEVKATMAEANHLERVLGTKARSGGQWDIWQAVFGPTDKDGYVKPIWDKMTGEIDPEVAAYWKENYDLGHILRRDWDVIGPKLEGKIHIYVGDMDNAYLNNPVYLVEEFLESTQDPYYNGEIDYGDRFEHCWNGDHDQPNAVSRLRYQQMFAPKIVKRIMESAPQGADLKSWRY